MKCCCFIKGTINNKLYSLHVGTTHVWKDLNKLHSPLNAHAITKTFKASDTHTTKLQVLFEVMQFSIQTVIIRL